MKQKYEVKDILKKLLKTYSKEEIAVCVGKSSVCVDAWIRGRRNVSKGDYMLLTGMLEKKGE